MGGSAGSIGPSAASAKGGSTLTEGVNGKFGSISRFNGLRGAGFWCLCVLSLYSIDGYDRWLRGFQFELTHLTVQSALRVP